MTDSPPPDDYPGVCRLFPLPRVVLFPHAVLPLHIFEPRYREMIEDALADGDKLIAMVQLSEGPGAAGRAVPPIEPVACLGRLLQHQRLPDGRFDLLLLGLRRVRLVREVPSEKLYRLAEIEVLEDVEPAPPDDARRAELLGLFRKVAGGRRPVDPELESLLNSPLSLGMLTDLLAHTLAIPPARKQALLAETRVSIRAETLVEILAKVVAHEQEAGREPRGFPPPFSAN